MRLQCKQTNLVCTWVTMTSALLSSSSPCFSFFQSHCLEWEIGHGTRDANLQINRWYRTKIDQFSKRSTRLSFKIICEKFKKKTEITANIFSNRKLDMQCTKVIIILQLKLQVLYFWISKQNYLNEYQLETELSMSHQVPFNHWQ